MKSGYKSINKILKAQGFKNSGVLGTVWSSGSTIRNYLKSIGYKLENGINHPTYDYIIIGKSKASLENVQLALTKLNSGGKLIVKLNNRWTLIQGAK